METSTQTLPPPNADARAAVTLPVRGLAEDDDVALGCECANPALQIERWGSEAPLELVRFN